MICKNCSRDYDGHFCPNCGQKWINKRITLWDSIQGIFYSVFNFDKGFFYTTKELFIRPGEVINDFLNGITVRYVHPFRFVFIWATITAIIGVYLNVYEESGLMFNKMVGQSEESLEKSRKILIAMKQYMSFIIVGMLPFMALGSYLVLFKKKFNYAEHLVLMAFSNGASIAAGIPILLAHLFFANNQAFNAANLIISILVIGWIFSRTFKEHYLLGVIKYFLSFVLGCLFFAIGIVIFMFGLVLFMKVTGMENPFR